MSRLRDWIAGLRHELSWRRLRARRRLLGWVDPLAGTDEVRLQTAEEIALDNAADSLGATAGDYYASEEELKELEAEGIFDEPVELPPELQARADAAREELMVYARRVKARRQARRRVRRQRVAILATTMLLTVAVAGAGASVLVSGSTGVPAVDRLLGIYEAGLSDSQEGEPPPPPGPSGAEPMPGASSVSVEAPVAGSTQIVGTAYSSVDQRICSVLVRSSTGLNRPLGNRACIPPSLVARRLTAAKAFPDGIEVGETTVLRGYAAEDVESMTIAGPYGPLRVRLSESWTPAASETEPLRIFIATYSPDLGEDGLSTEELTRIIDYGNYRLSVRLQDGQTVMVAPERP